MEKVAEAGQPRSECSIVESFESIVIDDSSSESKDVTVQEGNLKRTNEKGDSQNGSIEIVEPDKIKFPSVTEFFASYLQDWFSITQSDSEMLKLLSIMMTSYKRNTQQFIERMKSRSKSAIELKSHYLPTLQLFHGMREEMMDTEYERKKYLTKMSDLLRNYIDLEIICSRSPRECLPKIASKITSALFLYLDDEKLILDTVMKSNRFNKNYSDLWNLIFRRVVREFPSSSTSLNMNIRYFFLFKLWESVTTDRSERRKILELANEKLCPHPDLKDVLTSKDNKFKGLFPNIPKNCDNVIKYLLKSKFPVRERAKTFVKYLNQSEQDSQLNEDNSNDSISILFPSEDEFNFSSMWLEYEVLTPKVLAGGTPQEASADETSADKASADEASTDKASDDEASVDSIGRQNGSQSTEDSDGSGVSKMEKRKNHEIQKKDIWTNILKGGRHRRGTKRKRKVVKINDQNNNKSQIKLSHQSNLNITPEKVKTESDIDSDSDSGETSGTSSTVVDTTVKNECESNLRAVSDKSRYIKNEPIEIADNSCSDIDNSPAVNERDENSRVSPESISPTNGKVQVKNENSCESSDINSPVNECDENSRASPLSISPTNGKVQVKNENSCESSDINSPVNECDENSRASPEIISPTNGKVQVRNENSCESSDINSPVNECDENSRASPLSISPTNGKVQVKNENSCKSTDINSPVNECDENSRASPDSISPTNGKVQVKNENSCKSTDINSPVNECDENSRASPLSISPTNGKVQVKNENSCKSTDINSPVNECDENSRASPLSISPTNGKVQVKNENSCKSTDINSPVNECDENSRASPLSISPTNGKVQVKNENSCKSTDINSPVNECDENSRASPEIISPTNGKVQVKNENSCESTDINSPATDDINIKNKNENNLIKTEFSNSSKETATVIETNQDSLLIDSDSCTEIEDELNKIKVTEKNRNVEDQIYIESSIHIDLTLSPEKDVAKSVKLSADDKHSNLDFITDEIIDLIQEEDDSARIKSNEEGKPSIGESHDFEMVDTLNQCIPDLDSVGDLIIDESYGELNAQISSSPGKDLLFINNTENTECKEICVVEDSSPEENLPSTSVVREALPTIINLLSDDEEDNKESTIINKKHALDLSGENCESSIDIEDLLGGIQVSEVSESTPSLSKDIGELCKKSEGNFDWPTSSSDASNLVDKNFCTSSITTTSTTYTTTSINYSPQNNKDAMRNYEVPDKISSSSLQDNNCKPISNMNNKSDSFAQASHFSHVDKNVDCSNVNSGNNLFSEFSSVPFDSHTTSVTNTNSTSTNSRPTSVTNTNSTSTNSMSVNNSTLSIAGENMSPNVVNGFNTDKAGITSSISDSICVTCNANTMLNDSVVYKQQTFPSISSGNFSYTNYSPSKENGLTKSNANNVDFTTNNLYITSNTNGVINEPATCAQQNYSTALRNGSVTNSMQTYPFVGNSHHTSNRFNNPFLAMEYNNAFPKSLPQYSTSGTGHISGEQMTLNNFHQVNQRFNSPGMHNMYNYSYSGIRPNYPVEMRPRYSTTNSYCSRANLNTMNSFRQNYFYNPQNAVNRDFITPTSHSLISAVSSRQNPVKRGSNRKNAGRSQVLNPYRQSLLNRNCNSSYQFPLTSECYERSKVPLASSVPDLSFQMLNPASLVNRNCSSFQLPHASEGYGRSKVPLNSSASKFNQMNNGKASSIDNTKHSFMGLSKDKNLTNSSNSPEVSSSTDKSINENEALKSLVSNGDITLNALKGIEHNGSIKSSENDVVHSTRISEQNSSSLPECSSSTSNKTLKALISSGDISLNPVTSNVISRKNTSSAPGNLDSFGSKNKYYTNDTTITRNKTTNNNSPCSEVLDYSFSKNNSFSNIPQNVPKPANNENITEKDLMNFLNNSLNYIPNTVMANENKNVVSSKPLAISGDPNILQTHPQNKSNLEKETESSPYITLSPYDLQSCLESNFVSETSNGLNLPQSSHIPKEIANKKLFQLRFRRDEIKYLKTTFDFHLEEIPTNPPSRVHYDAYNGGMFIQVFGFSFYVPDAFEYFVEIKTKFLTDYSYNYNRINNMYEHIGSLNSREDMNKTNTLHTLTLKKDYSLFQIQNKLSVNIEQSIFQLQSVLYTFNKEPRCTCVLCGGNNITLLANNSMLEALHLISLISKNIPNAESIENKSDILILPMTENCSKKLESGDTSILPLKKRRTSNSESYPWNDGKEIMMSIASFHSPNQSFVPPHMQDSYPQYYETTENLKDNFADLVEHCRNAYFAMQKMDQEMSQTQHQHPANQPLDENRYEPSTKLEDFVLPESQGYILCKDTPFNTLRGQTLNYMDVPSTSGSQTGNKVITSPSGNRGDCSNLPRNVSSAIKITSNVDKSLYYMIPKQKQSHKRKYPMQTRNTKRPRKNKQ